MLRLKKVAGRIGIKDHFNNKTIINQSSSDRMQTLNLRGTKKFFVVICTLALITAIGLVACNKDNQLSTQKSAGAFSSQPYTYLQNKYMDLVLAYEFEKQDKEYSPDKFSYEEKLETILLLDSIKTEEGAEETREDVLFHQKLERELMEEINSHPYLQSFIAGFALTEDYDENDMMIPTGYGCHDAISKFLILKYYENGININDIYLNRKTLTGDEEWSLPPVDPMPKAARYTGFAKWSNNKIEYMWNGASSSTKTGVVSAMADWRTASNNKISFSEITKNVSWNKTCWVMGWKWFLRISSTSGNISSVGYVPWAFMNLYNTDAATCRHELGHVLGLIHEHQRADRDNYITYHSNNIISGSGTQFTKTTAGLSNSYGSTFDFNSIMLYDSYAFAKVKTPRNPVNATLTKKDGTTTWYEPTDISATDKNVIRQIYN